MRDRLLGWLRGLRINAGLLIVSYIIAVIAWLFVQSQQIETQRVRVDLELRTSPALVNTEPPVVSVMATVQGPISAARRAQLLRPTLVVDLTDERAGKHEVPLEAWPVEGLPSNLKVLGFTPQSITVRLEARTTRAVKVVARTVGTPDAEHAIKSVTVGPETVEITGPKQVVAGVESVDTKPLDVTGWSADGDLPAELELPRGVEVLEPWTGMAHVTLDALTTTLTVSEVRVVVPDHPDWVVTPDRVAVVLEGPAKVLRGLQLDHVLAVVDLPSNPTAASYTARFQSAKAPRLELLFPREDVLHVAKDPGPVEVTRR